MSGSPLAAVTLLLLSLFGSGAFAAEAAAASRWRPGAQQQQLLGAADDPPQEFFEVSKPVRPPNSGTAACTLTLLRHSFANTINSPPVSVAYDPNSSGHAACIGGAASIVLRYRGECKGRQFDRISAVWLSGVELLRTSTAEPTQRGIVWEVRKDVSAFASLFKRKQTLVVSLGNVVDKTYTGIFNITLRAEFYASDPAGTAAGTAAAADLVLPIARRTPERGGYWFQLEGAAEEGVAELRDLPTNIRSARLEVCVSFHGNDEFWYSNPTDDYVVTNNLTGSVAGGGAFREVVAALDNGTVIGVLLPFPVVFTGGINPLFWRPAVAIGAFNLPSYTLDVTPFVGLLVDRRPHTFALRVSNAISFWLLGANLHLWLDRPAVDRPAVHGVNGRTSGGLTAYAAPPADVRFDSRIHGLDAQLVVSAARVLSYSGYVVSSLGNLTTSVSYSYALYNRNVFYKNGDGNRVMQQLNMSRCSQTTASSAAGEQQQEHQQEQEHEQQEDQQEQEHEQQEEWSASFPLEMVSEQKSGRNKTSVLSASIWQHPQVRSSVVSASGSYFSSLDNSQRASGRILLQGNSVISGYGQLNQTYAFHSGPAGDCYRRELRTYNYTILYDHITTTSCVTQQQQQQQPLLHE